MIVSIGKHQLPLVLKAADDNINNLFLEKAELKLAKHSHTKTHTHILNEWTIKDNVTN